MLVRECIETGNACVLEDSMCTITGDCASVLVEEMKKRPARYCGMMVDGKMVEVIFLEDCSFEESLRFEYKMKIWTWKKF